MRTLTLALVGLALGAGPAAALDNGNVGQPSRITTQSGQTSGGPIDTGPYSGGSAGVVYGPPPVVEEPFAVPGPAVEPGPPPGAVVVVPVR